MVVAGTREGKNDVNVRLEAAGVARNLRTERPKPAQILAAVEAVLEDAAMRERVAEVASALDAYDSLAIVESALRQDFPDQALPMPHSPAPAA
jgi:UDP:flavonoid glycosyltransferase YjiC (YdhE family)